MALAQKSTLLSLMGLCCVNFVISLDAVALSVAIPIIATSLHATSVQAYWTGTAFVLSSSVFQPVFAALSNGFGRSPTVLSTLLVFLVGTVVCSIAHDITVLLVGRTLQGIGCGGIISLTYVILADLLSLRERAKGIAIISVFWLVGSASGPILGGGFASHVTWRWIFWICLPPTVVGFILIMSFLNTPHQPLKAAEAVGTMDWIGAAMFVGSLTSFLVAISWGGSMYRWSSWHTLVPLLLGASGLAVFCVYEAYGTKTPIMPPVIFKNPTTAIAFALTLMMGLTQYGLVYYLPLYFEVAKGYTPLVSGAALVPLYVTTSIASVLTGSYITKTGHYRRVISVGWALVALSCGIFVLLKTTTSIPAWFFMELVCGLGFGHLYTSLTIAAQAPQSEEYMTTASSLTPFWRAVGQALGIVIGDAVYQNVLRAQLKGASSHVLQKQADVLSRDSASIGKFLAAMPPGSLERDELMEAFVHSLHAMWWTYVGFALFAGLLSLLIEERSLDNQVRSQTPNPSQTAEEAFAAARDFEMMKVAVAKSSTVPQHSSEESGKD